MAIANIDLSQEIENWKTAAYGKDVRQANVAAFEKIQGTVNDTVQNVNQAAEDSASAAHNAQAAVDSIQAAIVTATEKAAAAATSATQAAGSQAAADSSKTAAAQSETNAAASAAEARQIAEGFGGFDGTAASVKATDTYGLVVDALGESTAQVLIDAVANKVMNELIAKSNIVNNLLATEVGTVLSGALGPIIDQRLTDLMNKYTQLNGDLKIKFLDVTCQKGKTETDELNAYDNIVTGMASMSNNDYIIGYILINERLIINSTTAHTVRVYYINVPKG
ncbi:hypothetical protein [[Clostridium] symbiosum]|uniref:hypothetical protein n=1 Tax=Clostridium symbiosum TaxID=1512 RepID=UPI00232EB3FB|nr:hypothetical protein [[Clostridium] symbiosum]MDB2010633.1 hypothetical protein [[Clostridium] symbiosum]MDB2027266.1 hypothetical protein [[Clostridium] symbiosum]